MPRKAAVFHSMTTLDGLDGLALDQMDRSNEAAMAKKNLIEDLTERNARLSEVFVFAIQLLGVLGSFRHSGQFRPRWSPLL
jgi:hypothetical protein